ncbi:hypothetical protein F4775DRAFT_588192 [Biscogniauxia sp. FL1348]|nr:hypothetical protein F4775DRAFT_588192 [Biscogniauxia sp. FL1348]
MSGFILPKRGCVRPKREPETDQESLPKLERLNVSGENGRTDLDVTAKSDTDHDSLEKDTDVISDSTAENTTDNTTKQGLDDPNGPADSDTDEDDTDSDATVDSDEHDEPLLVDAEDESVTSLRLQFAKLNVLDAYFPQFNKLPPELRSMIWEASWEARNVLIDRHLIGTRNRETMVLENNGGNVPDARMLRSEHHLRNLCYWGDPGCSIMNHIRPDLDFEDWMETCLVTLTRSTCKPPISLWVNHESRCQTLRKYERAFHLIHGYSTIYFNFEKDMLYFSLHSPLAAAFTRRDMSRLTRLSIPAIEPPLRSFIMMLGDWDISVPDIHRRDEEDNRYEYPEFKYVWRLMRCWFPALREINIQPFHECDCYNVTKRLNLHHPILINVDVAWDVDDYDDFCYSCFNIQDNIHATYPLMDISQSSGQDDFNRIMQREGILAPVHREETLVIGTYPPTRVGGERQKVIVNYVAIYNDGHEDLPEAERVDMDVVNRFSIARTLQHAFGQPDMYETTIFKM